MSTTTPSPEVIEAAAKAIFESVWADDELVLAFPEVPEASREIYLAAARTVYPVIRAAVLEEAAQMVERTGEAYLYWPLDGPKQGFDASATAIRALISPVDGEGR